MLGRVPARRRAAGSGATASVLRQLRRRSLAAAAPARSSRSRPRRWPGSCRRGTGVGSGAAPRRSRPSRKRSSRRSGRWSGLAGAPDRGVHAGARRAAARRRVSAGPAGRAVHLGRGRCGWGPEGDRLERRSRAGCVRRPGSHCWLRAGRSGTVPEARCTTPCGSCWPSGAPASGTSSRAAPSVRPTPRIARRPVGPRVGRRRSPAARAPGGAEAPARDRRPGRPGGAIGRARGPSATGRGAVGSDRRRGRCEC